MAIRYEEKRNFWGKTRPGSQDISKPIWEASYDNYGRETVSPQFRNQQLELAKMLMGQATGQGDSLAQQQLQQATDQNIAQQRALASSARGVNMGLAQRLAQTGAGQAQQQLAGQSAIARLQEQQGAQNMLGNVLGQGRSGDINVGQLGVMQRGQDIQNQQALNQQELEWAKALRGLNSGGSGGGVMSGIGGILGGIGSIFSDEDLKENITIGNDKIADFLDKIKAHEFNYKNPSLDGSGKKFGPMAQEIEKSEVGKSFIEETPRGKMVNYGQGLGVMLASQGYLNDRLDDIEKRLKIKKG